jgi:preprotein translocase subunit Sec63
VPVGAAIGAEVDSDAPAEHDPYAILGVPREASPQEIERAYSVAVSKYDETQVAHLGDAIQAHYRAKAEAVEQAFRQLTGTAA